MIDDDQGTSPYRQGGGGLPCPRCRASMLVATSTMTCAASGCGEWWSKGALAQTLDWLAVEIAEPFLVFGVAASEPPCPECGRGMIVSLRAKVEFAHCDAHGLWLDRGERATFEKLGGWSRLLLSSKRS
jgi:hypothetical protein